MNAIFRIAGDAVSISSDVWFSGLRGVHPILAGAQPGARLHFVERRQEMPV